MNRSSARDEPEAQTSSLSPVSSRVLVPQVPPRCVARPRLTSTINRTAALPLILVAAGPGSGKTVLLSEWAQARGSPTAWLTAQPSDDNPSRFWAVAAEALYIAGFIADTEAFANLPVVSGDSGVFLPALHHALGGPGDRTLVIDDAHHLGNPRLIAELDAIVRFGGSHLRLIIGSRSDPLLPLHRYRIAGQMSEIRADELAMTKGEARAVLSSHGVTLPTAALSALTRRTEGWAAGLRLSAMTMAGSRQPERFVSQLALDQGSVGEYLMEEVLSMQPPVVRQLLMQTSFLPELSGPLAAAVTGIDSSAQLLSELSRTNSFVIPLDRNHESYRVHQLLGEILRYLLRREYPDQQRALMSRAASWYEKQGETVAAMRLAVQAEDFAHAASVLVHGGLTHAYVEHEDLSVIGLDGISALEAPESSPLSPELRVAQAAVAAIHLRAAAAESALRGVPLEELNPDARAAAALVQVISAAQLGAVRELEEAAAELTEQLAREPGSADPEGLTAAVRVEHAKARFWDLGPTPEVDALLLDVWPATGAHPAVELECLDLLQLSSSLNGRLGHAKEYEARSRQLVRGARQLHTSAVHHLARAFEAFLRADFGAATRRVQRAEDVASTNRGDTAARAGAAMLRVWIEVELGRAADGYQLLRTHSALTGPLPAQLDRARLATAAELESTHGRANAGLRMLTRDAGAAKDPFVALAMTRALLQLGNAPGARRTVRPVLIDIEVSAPLPLLIGALLLSAQVSEAEGRGDTAAEEALKAIELAGAEIVVPFVGAEAGLVDLLGRHSELRRLWPSRDPSLDDTPPAASGIQRLAAPLTDRELSILRRLATTMTVAEIADELCVSINTVKTHIAAIYRKLPAAGRRDAVKRARRLELL